MLDLAERERTRAVLDVGALSLAKDFVLRSPLGLSKAMDSQSGRMAVRIGRVDERGVIRHLIYLAEACVLLQAWFASLRRIDTFIPTSRTNAAGAPQCYAVSSAVLPYSITMHGPEEFDAPRSNCLREKVHHAAFVVAISEFTRSQLYRWCALEDWHKVHVIHCGLDQGFLPPSVVPIPERPLV